MTRPTREEIADMTDEQRKHTAEAAMTGILTDHLDKAADRGAFHPQFRMENPEHRVRLAAQLAPLVLQLSQEIAQGLVNSTIDGFGQAFIAATGEHG